MISANGGLPAHRYTPQVTPRWPRGSEPASPLPPHNPPLRHSGGGLNVAASHNILAFYLNHRYPELPDPHLPIPRTAAPAPEAFGETAPEEVADYLWRTCRRLNNASGRQKGTPWPLRALIYPARLPYPTKLRLLEGWITFPRKATTAQMEPADQGAYFRGLETCLREAHCWHTGAPSP